MVVALISDTHDCVPAIERALSRFTVKKVQKILHCGDVVRPQTVKLFAGWPIAYVLGNSDDEEEIQTAIRATSGEYYGNVGEVILEGKSICFMHGDCHAELNQCIHAETFDFVVSGHTHKPAVVDFGSTRWICPGAMSSVAHGTYGLLDLPEGRIRILGVQDEP